MRGEQHQFEAQRFGNVELRQLERPQSLFANPRPLRILTLR